MAAKTILILDPDGDTGERLGDILRRKGCEVVVATTLTDAATIPAPTRFDLIVTEALEQTDVFDFDPTFLADLITQANGTPIILCSVYPSTDRLHPGDYGLAEVAPRPLSSEEFLEKVTKVIGPLGQTQG